MKLFCAGVITFNYENTNTDEDIGRIGVPKHLPRQALGLDGTCYAETFQNQHPRE